MLARWGSSPGPSSRRGDMGGMGGKPPARALLSSAPSALAARHLAEARRLGARRDGEGPRASPLAAARMWDVPAGCAGGFQARLGLVSWPMTRPPTVRARRLLGLVLAGSLALVAVSCSSGPSAAQSFCTGIPTLIQLTSGYAVSVSPQFINDGEHSGNHQFDVVATRLIQAIPTGNVTAITTAYSAVQNACQALGT